MERNYYANPPVISRPQPLRRSKSRMERLKESLWVQTGNHPLEKSAFSPDTPKDNAAGPSSHNTTFGFRLPRGKHTDKDVEAANTSFELGTSTSPGGFRSHLGRLIPTPRTVKSPPVLDQRHFDVKAQEEYESSFLDAKAFYNMPSFKPSRPLAPPIKTEDDKEFKKTMKQRRIRILVVSLTIVLLLIVAIILLVRLVRPQIRQAIGEVSGNSTATTLNQEQSNCVSSFIDTSSNPSAYSCPDCLPILQSIPQEVLSLSSNAATAERVQAAKQFCSLKSIFDSVTQEGQAQLIAGGWVKDIKTCTWSGVVCNGAGQVDSLELTFPATPLTLPDLSGFGSISKLKVTGNHVNPAGRVPANIPSTLQSLELVNTGVATIEDSFFAQSGALSKLTSLKLDGNTAMAPLIQVSLTALPLQTLLVRNQNLSTPLDPVFSSTAFSNSLESLDLSSNALHGVLPAINLPKLKNLNLAQNGIDNLPSTITFPPSLQTLSFQGNPDLSGTIPGALCTLSTLTTCDFTGTRFSAVQNVTCGVCKF